MPTPSIFASSIRALTFSFICLSFTLSTFKASAQCGAGTSVTLFSQADVDAFIANNCTDFLGTLVIAGGDITSLIPLASLTSVAGTLRIEQNGNLGSVAGLEGLTLVGESLFIQFNENLTSVAGLAGLTSVGNLFIQQNGNLGSVAGLEGLTSVESLFIGSNAMLSSVAGLSGLTTVGGNLVILFNGNLSSVAGLSGLTSVGGDLIIQSNVMLSSVAGLSGLTSVGGDLIIQSNVMLSSVAGLSGLTTVGGDLIIQSNAMLSSVAGLESLTSVGGDLGFFSNVMLSSVAGLAGLTSVGGFLIIQFNGNLSSLAGLAGLTLVGGFLLIQGNEMLGSNGVSDYCGLFTLLDGGGLTGNYFVIQNNTDPTQAEIIANGPCPCTNITCYADTDNDTFGDPDNTTDDTCECGTGFVENGDDCNDNDASINDINTVIYTHEGSCYATLTEAIAAAGNSGTVEINVSVNLQTANTVQPGVTIAIQDGVTVTNSSLLSNGGTINLLGTAQFVNGTAGTYSGGGTFDGDFVNNGTIQIGN